MFVAFVDEDKKGKRKIMLKKDTKHQKNKKNQRIIQEKRRKDRLLLTIFDFLIAPKVDVAC